MPVLESASDVAEDVGGGEDLVVGGLDQLPRFVVFWIAEFADFLGECLGFAGDTCGEVVLPVFELSVDPLEMVFPVHVINLLPAS